MEIFNYAFPEEYVPERDGYQADTIVNEDVIKLKNTLDILFVVSSVSKDNDATSLYKEYREKYRRTVQEVKSTKITNSIQRADNRNKAIWSIINMETGKRREKRNIESTLTASEFNEFFANIGKELAETIPGPKMHPEIFLKTLNNRHNSGNSIYMSPTTESEIMNIVMSFKNKKTADIYGMNAVLLKKIITVLVRPITGLMNRCLESGVFPGELKRAKIIPIYKKGESNIPNNYRPIAILPIFSKILETIIKNRLVNYFEQNQLFDPAQHGYRKCKSTTTALTEVLETVSEAFDRRECARLVCCDLSKAFDSVEHGILLNKLHYYGIRGPAHKIMQSYLVDREQQVLWNGVLSEVRIMNRGVPQGSILGPILFIIYTNDLPVNLTTHGTFLYADDTSLLVRSPGPQCLQSSTDIILAEASEWFCANELKLNPGKTQYLNMSTRVTREEENIKFLGLHFTSNMSWNVHVAHLENQLASGIFSIRRIRKTAGYDAARLTYFANFHSRATYGILLWGGSSAANKIFKQQKAALRALANAKYRDSCRDLFPHHRILTLPSCYVLACLLHVHGATSYTTHTCVHNYNTRTKNNIVLPYHRVNAAQISTNHMAIKIYNRIPEETRKLPTHRFKMIAIRFLISKAFYTIDEFMNDCDMIKDF